MKLFILVKSRKGLHLLLLCILILGCGTLANEAAPQDRGKYPDSWDIKTTPGTKLAALIKVYDKKINLLPPADLDDRAPLPAWFRGYLREKLTGLPTTGRPQYPKEAAKLLLWFEKNQDFSQGELNSRLAKLGQEVPAVKDENKKRARYPAKWEVKVPAGTKLDKLRKRLDAEFSLLPEKDIEDTTPIPIWFRVYMRKQFPDLPKSGPYQYPRTANRILHRMLSNPDADEYDRQ